MADQVKIQFSFENSDALQKITASQKKLADLTNQWNKATDEQRAAAKAAADEFRKLAKAEKASLEAAAQAAKKAADEKEAAAKRAAQAAEYEAKKVAEAAARAQEAHRRAWRFVTTDVDKLGASFRDAHPKITRFAEGIANVAAGVAAGVGGMVALGTAAAQLLATVEQQDAAVRRLGSAYEAVSAATNGAMSAQQALTLQGQIQSAGIQVNSQQLGLLARAARDYALATGNDAAQAVEKLTNAIVNNSEDALSELGLAQARATTSTQTLANMTRELEQRFQGTAPAARTLGEDLQKLPEVIQSIGASAASAAAGGLARFIDAVNGAGTAARIWQDIVGYRDTQRNLEQQRRSQAAMNARADQRERTNTLFREGNVRINEANAANFGSLSTLTEQERSRVNRAANPLFWNGANASESVNRELAAISEERMQRQAAEGQRALAMSEIAAGIERKMRKTGDQMAAAGASAEQLAERLMKAKEAVSTSLIDLVSAASEAVGGRGFRNRFQSAASALGLEGETAEQQADLFGGIADSMEGGGSTARAARSRRSRIAGRNRETRAQALQQDRSVGGGMLRGLGVNGDALETEAKLSQGYADTIVGAYSKIGDAITRHVELVASGQETIGQAMLNGVHEVTKALAMEALPKSLMELAAGFAALANPITAPTAPLHFTAAAVYGSVAAGAGIVAGVTGALGAGQSAGASSGARATGSARAASGASPRPAQEAAAPVTIYLSSIVPPGPRELQGLVNATAQAGRYNLDRRRDMVPRAVRT